MKDRREYLYYKRKKKREELHNLFLLPLAGPIPTDQYLVKHEFFKELMKAYKKEGIEISYPVTNIYMRR